MGYVFLILAIFTLCAGHFLKAYRWSMFIKPYEKPDYNLLLQSLSLGYIVNFFVPFRIGDLARAWNSGRKMKNGVSFSLATIIVDRFLDVVFVGIIFILFYFVGFKTGTVISSIALYSVISIILVIAASIAIKYNKYLKIAVKKFAGIFNDKIELKILKLCWFSISCFKDLFNKLEKIKLYGFSILMWIMYITSYSLFALTLQNFGSQMGLIDIFMLLFSKANLDIVSIQSNPLISSYFWIIAVYIVSPLVIMIIVSLTIKKSKKTSAPKKEETYLQLLPHVNQEDRLLFLEGYFSAKSKEYFDNYLKINRDICILQDYSAGSNATTMLCTDDKTMFFRKYSFGDDANKLYEQIKWLKEHKNCLKLTPVLNVKYGSGYCCYDMPYDKSAVGSFNYVHSTPIKQSWPLLEKVLNDISKNLYTKNVRNSDEEHIQKYINIKVIKNLNIIKEDRTIRPILKYDNIYINGKKYKNLKFFEKYLTYDYLYDIFKNDYYSDLHGDLTIENIICVQNHHGKDGYYIIDPNTGNVHDSPFLDYSKLLQSLHGGYEFLMRTKNVDVYNNYINFLNTKSAVYDQLYANYKKYLEKHFSKEQVKSIFFHEIVHWLRLMPYKLRKDNDRAMLFYSGLIVVLNDVIEEYGDKNE